MPRVKNEEARYVEPGMLFGKLSIISRDFDKEKENKERTNRNDKYYICQCECGNETTVREYELFRSKSPTISCGCAKKKRSPNGVKDLTDLTFGNLHVIKIDETKPYGSGKHTYWICDCLLCGNQKSIRGSYIVDGTSTDCGCQSKKRMQDANTNDLNGMTFGHLKVIERDYESGGGYGHHARWFCQCELCGQIESVDSQMLLYYGKDRCRLCSYTSIGERKIIELLTDNGIPFLHDKSYLNLKSPDVGGTLRFDFRITENSDCDYIIEFDGEQHFKQVQRYDDNISFESRQTRDKFKNQWCRDNSISLIRIPYTRLKNLTIDDLRPETSEFLVS